MNLIERVERFNYDREHLVGELIDFFKDSSVSLEERWQGTLLQLPPGDNRQLDIAGAEEFIFHLGVVVDGCTVFKNQVVGVDGAVQSQLILKLHILTGRPIGRLFIPGAAFCFLFFFVFSSAIVHLFYQKSIHF